MIASLNWAALFACARSGRPTRWFARSSRSWGGRTQSLCYASSYASLKLHALLPRTFPLQPPPVHAALDGADADTWAQGLRAARDAPPAPPTAPALAFVPAVLEQRGHAIQELRAPPVAHGRQLGCGHSCPRVFDTGPPRRAQGKEYVLLIALCRSSGAHREDRENTLT